MTDEPSQESEREGVITLTSRFGQSSQHPSVEDMRRAVSEVYREDAPGLTEADHAEHPNAWLDYGYESAEGWTVFTVDVYRSHSVLFTKLADQDDPEPEFEHRLEGVEEDAAVELWKLLAQGKVSELLQRFDQGGA